MAPDDSVGYLAAGYVALSQCPHAGEDANSDDGRGWQNFGVSDPVPTSSRRVPAVPSAARSAMFGMSLRPIRGDGAVKRKHLGSYAASGGSLHRKGR